MINDYNKNLQELRDIDHLNLFDFSIINMIVDPIGKRYICYYINKNSLGFEKLYDLEDYNKCLSNLKDVYSDLNKYLELIRTEIKVYKSFLGVYKPLEESLIIIESYLLKIKLEKELEEKPTIIKRTKI